MKHNAHNSHVLKDFSISAFSAGFVAVLVGFASSLAIVLQAAHAMDLPLAIVESWVLALGVGMGICCLGLSWYYKNPIIIAWSTPGAALLATSLQGLSIEQATGVFLFVAALSLLIALSGTFNKVAQWIPMPIAAALLAGVLVKFGFSIFTSFQLSPVLIGLMLITFFGSKYFAPRYAVILTLVSGALYLFFGPEQLSVEGVGLGMAKPYFVMPEFELSTIIGVGIPLFIVTMSAQNLPGIAVLKASGYHDQAISPLIGSVNVVTLVLAPFGCFALNLAAITAAICTGEESHHDLNKRYIAGISAGLFNILAGLMAVSMVGIFASFPMAFISALAGLALLGTIASSLHSALAEPDHREAALVTFLVCASGMSFAGVSGAFWGVVLGVVLQKMKARKSKLA